MALPRSLFLCVFPVLGLAADVAFAQSKLAEINQKTVTVLSGESQWFQDALAISSGLANTDGMRALAMHGDGCIDSAADVLQLTQVDVALLTTDCIEYAEAQGLLPAAQKKLTYITRLRAVPLFIVTRIENKTLTSLAGKRIATGPAHSATFASGELILGGLDLPFTRVARSGKDAIKLLQLGETDAVLLQGLAALDGSLDKRQFHVLGLTAPQAELSNYAPALVGAEYLMGLGGTSTSLETVSTSLILAVYNWPKNSAKARKIKQFTEAYFEQQSTSETANELTINVPGWIRHATAETALETLNTTTPKLQQGDGP